MREGLPIHEPVEGDVVLAARPDGRPDRERQIAVDCTNIEKATAQCKAGKAFVSGVLFGSESEFAAGRGGGVEKGVGAPGGLRGGGLVSPPAPGGPPEGGRRGAVLPGPGPRGWGAEGDPP